MYVVSNPLLCSLVVVVIIKFYINKKNCIIKYIIEVSLVSKNNFAVATKSQEKEGKKTIKQMTHISKSKFPQQHENLLPSNYTSLFSRNIFLRNVFSHLKVKYQVPHS